jgi:hypothetical protein
LLYLTTALRYCTAMAIMEQAGPFATDREAHAAALQMGGPPRPGWSILSAEQNQQMLMEACNTAGVDLGGYDELILSWLAKYEDAMCAVVAGLIIRAGGPKRS